MREDSVECWLARVLDRSYSIFSKTGSNIWSREKIHCYPHSHWQQHRVRVKPGEREMNNYQRDQRNILGSIYIWIQKAKNTCKSMHTRAQRKS